MKNKTMLSQICLKSNIIYESAACIIAMIVAYLKPTFPFILVCSVAILFDCFTAFTLNKRLKVKFPDKATGKFQSKLALKVIDNLIKIYALIFLAYIIDKEIFVMADLYLANYVAAIFCIFQIVSILENQSSCNDARWAKIAQKFLISKVARHLEMDEEEINKVLNESKENNKNSDDNQHEQR